MRGNMGYKRQDRKNHKPAPGNWLRAFAFPRGLSRDAHTPLSERRFTVRRASNGRGSRGKLIGECMTAEIYNLRDYQSKKAQERSAEALRESVDAMNAMSMAMLDLCLSPFGMTEPPKDSA